MGTIFGFTLIGALLLVIGFVIGWDNDDKDTYVILLVTLGVSFIAVALCRVYLLTKGIEV